MIKLSCHIYIERSDRKLELIENAPPMWAWHSHCLELDVVSQGLGVCDAASMLMDALDIHILDTNRPWTAAEVESRRAPQEAWDHFYAAEALGNDPEGTSWTGTLEVRIPETLEELIFLRLRKRTRFGTNW